MSTAGSSWCREAASSHACQLATITILFVHGSNAHMDIMGAMWWEAENKKRKRSDAERGQQPSWERWQVEPVDTSRVTIEHEIPLSLSLSLKSIHPHHFIFLSLQIQAPATSKKKCVFGGGVWLTYSPYHASGGCHIMPNYHAVARRGPMGWLWGGEDGWKRSAERYEEGLRWEGEEDAMRK